MAAGEAAARAAEAKAATAAGGGAMGALAGVHEADTRAAKEETAKLVALKAAHVARRDAAEKDRAGTFLYACAFFDNKPTK